MRSIKQITNSLRYRLRAVFTPTTEAREWLAMIAAVVRVAVGKRQEAISRLNGAEVVMLVISELRIDPRVERAARSLAAAGYSVRIVAPDLCRPPGREDPLDWGAGVEFHWLDPMVASYVMGPPWLYSQKLVDAVRQFDPAYLHCHDLNTALIGLLIASETGARCICDFHEWFSENVTWYPAEKRWGPHAPFQRFIFRLIERLVLWRADEIITVCDSIATDLNAELAWRKRDIKIVRNIPHFDRPDTKTTSDLKVSLGIPTDTFVVLWQGGTGPTRLIEPIIEGLRVAPDVTLVIRGPSLDMFGDAYREIALRDGTSERLFLLPPVPSNEVVNAALSADCGIWSLPNLCKNFYYALPNKLFEYLAAGLPVLVANYPEAANIVNKYRVGLCFNPTDPMSIGEKMQILAQNSDLRETLRRNIEPALSDLDANREWLKLVKIYDSYATNP
jgi:glycosyltransferase involved in cell wall biosynthesis